MPLHMHHVGIVVTDLAAATAFFVDLGLKVEGKAAVGGRWVDRVIGLSGVQSDIVMLETPDGGRIELSRFVTPRSQDSAESAAANTPGIRHLSFGVDDLHGTVDRLRSHGAELIGDVEDYEDTYLLCYLRGPEGIIIELAERIASAEPQG